PNDPKWPDQWHMRQIKADQAWDRSFGSNQITVAVMDTGVNTAHEDLAANIWVNTGEIAGNGIDDDGNGYIDDRNGYDFAYSDPIPNDVNGHGTACAGLVAAAQDNSLGGSGVAPRAKIMALKSSIDSGYFYDSANVPAYLYAADNGAKVLSMSFYSDRVSHAERQAIDYCWSRGVLPVAAAGNDNTVYSYYPAAYENTLSVAATTQNDSMAGFSNRGSWVDVAAPGTGLTTTSAGGGYTGAFGGTSGACPHVAGLAALIWGARPNLTVDRVRSIIEDTATPLSQAPFGEFSNYGLVNCKAAMDAALDGTTTVRTPLVRYVTPTGVSTGFLERTGTANVVSRVYGRGFDGQGVMVTSGGVQARIVGQSRDWIDFILPPSAGGALEVEVNNVSIATVVRPVVKTLTYPLIEAATQGATLTGGFAEALSVDGAFVRCTRRNDGVIRMHSTFRRVEASPEMDLVLSRRYTGTKAGTENVYLYDWSSASYPYGNFVLLHSGRIPQNLSSSVIRVPDAARFRDFEGTLYLQIETSGTGPGAAAEYDLVQLRDRR
ncbi:MAG TPA: S8 family peptidase, partial [Fimbriimonadaceae bacterium]|nr:S8 family peptidase [Fimbriimonadaceae bacterium]